LSSDIGLQENFKSYKKAGKYWISVQNEYPSLAEEVLKVLILFATSYL
jgi:hypothetical protein